MAYGKSLEKSSVVSDYPKPYKEKTLTPKVGETRAMRRHAEHFTSRKNTRGVPLGYSKRQYDASKAAEAFYERLQKVNEARIAAEKAKAAE